jgi:hypothetical protein
MRALALGVLAACGDNLADPDEARSGIRIKLVRYVYDDGTSEIERTFFFDRELGTKCFPEVWSDGARYCTPPHGEAVFVDAACTGVLGRVTTGGTPPRFFTTSFELAKGPSPLPSHLHLAEERTPAPPLTWKLHEGRCLGPFVDDTGAYDYYAVGNALPIDSLRIKHTAPPGLERLEDIFATSADGLRVAIGVHDHALSLECIAAGTPGSTTATCTPRRVDTYLSYFTDPQCSDPVVPVVSASPPAIATLERPGTSCSDYYRVTTEVHVTAIYQLVGGTCIPEPLPASQYLRTQRLELATLPRRPAGAHRLQPIELGELVAPDRLLRDSALDADCERSELPSHELRCLPAGAASLRTLFSDDGCQTPLQIALVGARECDPPLRFVKDSMVHPILEPYAAPIYELTTGDRCGVFPVTPGFVPHAVGPALPFETFPAAQVVIDP